MYLTLFVRSAVLVECGAISDILILFTDGSSQVKSRDPPCSNEEVKEGNIHNIVKAWQGVA